MHEEMKLNIETSDDEDEDDGVANNRTVKIRTNRRHTDRSSRLKQLYYCLVANQSFRAVRQFDGLATFSFLLPVLTGTNYYLETQTSGTGQREHHQFSQQDRLFLAHTFPGDFFHHQRYLLVGLYRAKQRFHLEPNGQLKILLDKEIVTSRLTYNLNVSDYNNSPAENRIYLVTRSTGKFCRDVVRGIYVYHTLHVILAPTLQFPYKVERNK